MDRKLDVGGALGQTFSTYRSQAGVLLPLAFTLFLLVAVIEDLVASSLALFPLGLAVSVIAGTLYQGMVVNVVRDAQDGRRDSSVEELVRATMPVVLPLIGAGLLAGIGIGIGLLLLVVPGLILMTIWAVIAPVIVVERTGVLAAFGRSRELVRGNGWQVFGVIVSVVLITIVAGVVFGAIAVSISDTAVMRILFNVIASTLTAPIAALAAAVVYFRLRELDIAAPIPVEPPVAGGPLP
jgi:hypothetical protein